MEFYDRIDDYLEGILTSREREVFEQTLKNDRQLQRAVNLRRPVSKVYDIMLEESLSREIVAIDPTLKKAEGEDIPARKTYFTIKLLSRVAAIIVLIALAFFWYANAFFSDHSLVDRFTDLPNVTGVKGEDNTNSLMQDARIAFSQGQYDKCINILSATDPADPAILEAQQLLGYAYLMTAEPDKAISFLSETIDANHNRKQRAEFHLALTYLKAGNKNSAISALETIISDPGHPYSEEAKALMDNIQSFWRMLLF